ncbi:MAG TPA: NrfD/PsrC family molybdoenzyme membrane anchor subunit [Gemmataceae bacterium]|nr:NrfD/PsrC family molybdoenzyme membrane anchor subunit [Gemmataceae bacterium]
MNLFVADPHWGWWIIGYFYLGGIAAGAYFAATLIDLFGGATDREAARLGYRIAFPLVVVCGVLLIVDLDRPARFWHMLLRSEIVHEALRTGWPWSAASWRLMVQAPLLKYWSPMSIGSWALLLFGLCSALSLLGSLWRDGRLARLLRWSRPARVLQAVGCGVGFFVAAYTGALLTATNQPLWSDSTWIAPLFLTSAASTGLSTLILLGSFRRSVAAESLHRLERADRWVLLLELAVFAVFLASLGGLLLPVLYTGHGRLLAAGTLGVGILVPLGMHFRPGGLGKTLGAAVFALVGGFILRYAILSTPPELLTRPPEGEPAVARDAVQADRSPWLPHFSPEDGREPGAAGADPGNRPAVLRPASKVFTDE